MSVCLSCGAALPPAILSCPSCRQLVHSRELQALSEQAKLAEKIGDIAGARDAWSRALPLLPPETVQYRTIESRITDLNVSLAAAAAPDSSGKERAKWLARFGAAGLVLWKFKAIALFAFTKAKFLLLGFTKLSTLTSMLASLGLYWGWYGWKFALGLVLSIYVHEMGHVAALRKYGIAATAPMFIPGFGAVVLLKQRPANVAQDARTGLAGPIWGLGAAIVAGIIGVLTGERLWLAIAHAGAWINLFNLIPVWQLDGSRGFAALTRRQRGWALAVALLAWALTEDTMLLLVAAGATYRLFTKDYAAQPDRGALFQYTGLVVLLSLLFYFCALSFRTLS
jgi:Zn-dependent protease